FGGAGERARARPHDIDLARRVEAGDARRRERAGRELPFDRGPRDEGDSVPRCDGRLDGLLEAQLDARVEIVQPKAGAPKLLLDHVADAGTLLHDDQTLRPKRIELHLAPRKGWFGWAAGTDPATTGGADRGDPFRPEPSTAANPKFRARALP